MPRGLGPDSVMVRASLSFPPGLPNLRAAAAAGEPQVAAGRAAHRCRAVGADHRPHQAA